MSTASPLALSQLEGLLRDIDADVRTVLAAPSVLLGDAEPSSMPGVYILSVSGTITYVGLAIGSGGLRDRLLKKHVFGGDGHAIQRAFKDEFPDRLLRRGHIKTVVAVQWVEVADTKRAAAVECVLICLLKPAWNRK